MVLLGIDTSSAIGSVALRGKEGLIGLLTVSVDLTHSEGLMPTIDTLLRCADLTCRDLTAIACVSGPGSYTGLRVGLATAQGLATPRRLPCAALSSLEVLAHALPHAQYPLCPLLTARKGWVYTQRYHWQNNELLPASDEWNLHIDDFIKTIQEPALLYGPGLPPHNRYLKEILGALFIEALPAFNTPRADVLTELAWRQLEAGPGLDPAALVPHYLGPCQAEVNWQQRQNLLIANY